MSAYFKACLIPHLYSISSLFSSETALQFVKKKQTNFVAFFSFK